MDWARVLVTPSTTAVTMPWTWLLTMRATPLTGSRRKRMAEPYQVSHAFCAQARLRYLHSVMACSEILKRQMTKHLA